MSKSSRSIVYSLAPILLCAGCATERIQVRVLRPAPVNLGQYKKVAVDHFTGNGGQEFVEDLIVALGNARNPVTGETGFEVLDRRDFDRVLQELTRRRGNQPGQQTSSLLDQLKETQVFIKGDVPVYGVADQQSKKQWVDQEGHPHTTYTVDSVASVSVLIETSHTTTGKVFDSIRFDEQTAGRSSAVDERPQPPDHLSLLAQARERVVGRYMTRVMPREEYIQVQLYKDGDFPELKVGNGFARTGSWDGALRSYRSALERMTGELAENRYEALYNLGVALEYTNQFQEAREALEEAYALEQNGMILSELQNVAVREQEYIALMEQGSRTEEEGLSATPPRTQSPSSGAALPR